MTITYHVPDAFLIWLWKQFIRIGAACVALGIIAFLLAIVFRAIAFMISALHDVFHEVHVFCISTNNVFAQSGLIGQFLMICILGGCLVWIIYRGGRFFFRSIVEVTHENS